MVAHHHRLLLLLIIILFVEQGSSFKEPLLVRASDNVTSISRTSSGERGSPSCEPDQGTFMIEAIYQGTPGTFDIATSALGEDADAPEIYHLHPFQHDLSQSVTYRGCFQRNTLHRFVVYVEQPDDDNNETIVLAGGEYNLTVNGRQIISATTQSNKQTFTQYFFAGDSHSCDGEEFTLTIQFDLWPFEISWRLDNDNSNDAVVPLTYESTLKNNSSRYTSDFDNNVLFVDHCLVTGDQYEFSIFDEANDGLLAPGYYEIATNGYVIVRQEGYFRSGNPVLVQSDGTSPTSAPNPTTPMPFDGVPTSPTDYTKKPASSTPVSFPEDPPKFLSGNEPSFGSCFTGSTTVFVKGKGATKMSDLNIGDEIAVGEAVYEPVYSFGHYEPEGEAKGFLELFTNQTTMTSLQVSPDHLVFVHRETNARPAGVIVAVPAVSIHVGDLLVLYKGEDQQTVALVEAIKPLAADGDFGLYAPFTPSGKFLVNGGLLVSSFIGFDHHFEVSDWSGFGMYQHWLAHSFEFPHRVACYHLGTCPMETYTKDGLSTWVAWPLEIALRMLNLKSRLLKAALFWIFVLVCAVFTLLEFLFFPSTMTNLLLFSIAARRVVKAVTVPKQAC